MFEVDFLPTITWDPAYLAAVAADPEGDVDPTPEQIAGSHQEKCILYYQKFHSRRRSGAVNRTAFMFTLDQLGYADQYDVYDVQGYGPSVGNQLATRATVEQCRGYALVIQDDGRSNLVPNLPSGASSEVDQAGWYREYLAQGGSGGAGSATLWVLGENTAFLHAAIPLFAVDFGLGPIADDQALAISPAVRGASVFTWANGEITDFTDDEWVLDGGCPARRRYDVAGAAMGAVVTHRYAAAGAGEGGGAVIMNTNAVVGWNTIWMGFPWFDIRVGDEPTSPTAQRALAAEILSRALPPGCEQPLNPSDAGPTAAVPPPRTELHANVPNPFNPATQISYSISIAGPVRLSVFDPAGRLVRTLVDAQRAPGAYREVWTGIDARGSRVPSGVYFYRLDAPGFSSARKMVLLQ